MATLAQIRNKADAKLAEFWDSLSARQEIYRTKHDNYFQLIVTSPVVDGEDTTFELIHPSDERNQVDVNFSFNSPIPFQIRVDTFGNDTELGYTATVFVELLDGRRFTRSRTLTDTRKRVRDIVSGSIETDDIVWGDWYLVGDAPTIETTAWEEVIEELTP